MHDYGESALNYSDIQKYWDTLNNKIKNDVTPYLMISLNWSWDSWEGTYVASYLCNNVGFNIFI